MTQAKVAVKRKSAKREKMLLVLGSTVIVGLYGLSAFFTYLVNASG